MGLVQLPPISWLLAIAALAPALLAQPQQTLPSPLLDIAGRLEQAERAQQVGLEQWCSREIAKQAAQRLELVHLRDQVAPLTGDETKLRGLSQRVDAVASLLEQSQTEIQEVSDKNVHTHSSLENTIQEARVLSDIEGTLMHDVSNAVPPPALRALRGIAKDKLITKTRLATEIQTQKQPTAAQLQTEQRLVAEYRSDALALAQLRTQRLAAAASQGLAVSALECDDSFAAYIQSICNLGQQVHGRYQGQVQPMLRSAVELVQVLRNRTDVPVLERPGDVVTVARSAAASLASQSPVVVSAIAAVPSLPALAPAAARLAGGVAPLSAVGAVVTTAPVAVAISTTHSAAKAEFEASTQAAVVTAPPHAPVASMATVTADNSNAAADSAVSAMESAVSKAKAASRAEAKAQDVEVSKAEETTSLQSEGWRSLLHKKTPQAKKHKFKDQTSAVMDLVQTPSTYTAWHPEQTSEAALETSAKSELLAAEKAFDMDDDDDDDDDDSSTKKKTAKKTKKRVKKHEGDDFGASFLELHQEKQHGTTKQASVSRANMSKANMSKANMSKANVSRANVRPSTGTPSSTAAAEGFGAKVARLVLEKYADWLRSPPLLQLSRAHLGVQQLRQLWQRASAIQTSSAAATVTATTAADAASGGAREAQASDWCRDYAAQAALDARKARATERLAALTAAGYEARRAVLARSIAAQQGLVQVVANDTQNLRLLLTSVQSQSGLMEKLLDQLQQEVHGSDTRASTEELSRLHEMLGRAEGVVASGEAELEDAIRTAISKRMISEAAARNRTESIKLELAQVEQQAHLLTQENNARAANAQSQVELRARYQQMCKWVQQGIEARERREQGERDAIRAAVAALEAK